MRKILIIALLMEAFMSGCGSKGNYIFRSAVDVQGQVDGVFKVGEAGLYSVSLESVVADSSPAGRDGVRHYLDGGYRSQSLVADVSVQKIGGSENSSVIKKIVTDPKFSSWTSENFYLELARTRLTEGEYRIHVSFSGKSLVHPGFSSSVVVEHTYIGK